MPPRHHNDVGDSNVELEPYRDHDDDDDDDDAAHLSPTSLPSLIDHPDSPLLEPTDRAQPSSSSLLSSSASALPKWLLSPPTTRARRHSAAATRYLLRGIHLLRPRRKRHLLIHALVLYVLVCFLRDQPLFASSLPARYTGAYDVGAIDVEVPVAEPRQLSATTVVDTRQPAYLLESVLFTLYYPVAADADADADANANAQPHHLWIPRPISLTARGFARFAHADYPLVPQLFTFFLWVVAGRIRIPAKVDAPLLPVLPQTASIDNDKDKDNGTSAGSGSGSGFPVMVFSHGMASSRTDYTAYMSELASHGHVVAALEHRDGSSPGTRIRIKGRPDRDRDIIHFGLRHVVAAAAAANTANTTTSAQPQPTMDTLTMKKEQLAFREAEMREVMAILAAINEGRGRDIYERNSRGEGVTLQRDGWAGRLDMSRVVVAGHSYGATGALQALGPSGNTTTTTNKNNNNQAAAKPSSSSSSSISPVAGVILDPGKESGPLNANIAVPVLVINSESWSRPPSSSSPGQALFFGHPHFDTVRDLVASILNRTTGTGTGTGKGKGRAWFVTARATSHPSITDAPLLEPYLLAALSATTTRLDPRVALVDQYVNATVDFLALVAEPNTHYSLLSPPPPQQQHQQQQHHHQHQQYHGLFAQPVTHHSYNQWVSRKRQAEFPLDLARLWQIHVAP